MTDDDRARDSMGFPTLGELLDAVADDLEEVSQHPAESAPEWQEHSRGGTVFARASSEVLEVRLPADIAEAALRTPDTSMLPGKPGWVRFAPASGERHVRDRAEAWYRTAWRHTGGPRRDQGKG